MNDMVSILLDSRFFWQTPPVASTENGMVRTRAALGHGARLTDFLSTSLLARVYPSSLIGGLLDTHKLCGALADAFDGKCA